jgi:hypothetical protein
MSTYILLTLTHFLLYTHRCSSCNTEKTGKIVREPPVIIWQVVIDERSLYTTNVFLLIAEFTARRMVMNLRCREHISHEH